MKQKTDKMRTIRYNEHNKCPLCGSEDLEINDDEMSNYTYTEYCECNKCHAEFTVEYLVDFAGVSHCTDESGNSWYIE